ncbi:hypothetical protein ABZX69_42685 [Streptomyces sp. NPDC004074]|uniref:hypothetical protein n=1 Tax=Streptomyces sp. NPDC004074 TaxID=3154277 RepID=UPI0033A85955
MVARSGDLKGELVAFAQSPRFARRLDARLDEAADRLGFLDEATAIDTIDHFALQHPLADGSSVLERFVAQQRPPLGQDERAMLLGWQVEGVFEVQGSAPCGGTVWVAAVTSRGRHRRPRSRRRRHHPRHHAPPSRPLRQPPRPPTRRRHVAA